MALIKIGKLDLARADLTKALELKPDYEMARSALADLNKAKGLPETHPYRLFAKVNVTDCTSNT